MEEIRYFELSELKVDQNNFRLGSFRSQRDAIRAMLTRHKSKLLPLAKDILEVGLSPGEPIWVAPDPESSGKYIVMEGNRRITALKVMNSPALADGTTASDAFRKLGKEFLTKPRREIRATVFESIEAARPWVERRHLNEQSGVGIEWWDPFAQDRSKKDKGKARNRSMVVLEYFSPDDIEGLADKWDLADRTTNADRVLNTFSEHYASKLGIKIGTKSGTLKLSDKTTGEIVLETLMRSCAASVSQFKGVEERRGHIEKTLAKWLNSEVAKAPDSSGTSSESSSESTTDSAEEGDGKSAEKAESSGTKPKGKRAKPDPLDRSTLAPTGTHETFHVAATQRLTTLYNESRNLLVDEFTNSAGLLLRVFLELSTEAYLKGTDEPIQSGYSDWSDRGIKLQDKVKLVVRRLDPDLKNRQLDYAREGYSMDPAIMHSVDRMHAYMHDPFRNPNPREIKQSWDRWSGLFRAIHERLSVK